VNLKIEKTITGRFILLFFIITFFWYNYVSISPSKSIIDLITNIQKTFVTDFFNPEVRGTISSSINQGINFFSLSTIQKIDFAINKLPYIFIFIGTIILFNNYKQKKFDWEYGFMVLANDSILSLVVIIPHFASAFLAGRFYHITLFYLAPICILGGRTFFYCILKLFTHVRMKISNNKLNVRSFDMYLMSIFLVLIFLFKIGFIYEVFGDGPKSPSISIMKMKMSHDNETIIIFYNDYVPEQDVFSAIWLSRMTENNTKTYADLISSQHVLRGYGMIIVKWKYYLSNSTIVDNDSYIYLRYLNVRGIFIAQEHKVEFTNLSHVINSINKIYSNGDSMIYRSFPGKK